MHDRVQLSKPLKLPDLLHERVAVSVPLGLSVIWAFELTVPFGRVTTRASCVRRAARPRRDGHHGAPRSMSQRSAVKLPLSGATGVARSRVGVWTGALTASIAARSTRVEPYLLIGPR
ncbi:MAG: hypothetical protein ACREQ5_39510 [Candidatus Dormibacteria bacterium]